MGSQSEGSHHVAARWNEILPFSPGETDAGPCSPMIVAALAWDATRCESISARVRTAQPPCRGSPFGGCRRPDVETSVLGLGFANLYLWPGPAATATRRGYCGSLPTQYSLRVVRMNSWPYAALIDERTTSRPTGSSMGITLRTSPSAARITATCPSKLMR